MSMKIPSNILGFLAATAMTMAWAEGAQAAPHRQHHHVEITCNSEEQCIAAAPGRIHRKNKLLILRALNGEVIKFVNSDDDCILDNDEREDNDLANACAHYRLDRYLKKARGWLIYNVDAPQDKSVQILSDLTGKVIMQDRYSSYQLSPDGAYLAAINSQSQLARFNVDLWSLDSKGVQKVFQYASDVDTNGAPENTFEKLATFNGWKGNSIVDLNVTVRIGDNDEREADAQVRKAGDSWRFWRSWSPSDAP